MSKKKFSVLLWLFMLTIVAEANPCKTYIQKKIPFPLFIGYLNYLNINDTTTFSLTNVNGIKILGFDNNNILYIGSKDIKLTVKEESEDSYTLIVRIKSKLVFTKKHIKGISKVFCDKDYLLFSIFTYTDEDGNNEGNGYVINLNNNSVKALSIKLSNTCNPIIIDKYAYFIDGLSLIRTNLDFKSQEIYKFIYSSKKNVFTYLDMYSIRGLSTQDNKKLIISFSPDKFVGKFKSYCGNVNGSSKFIQLK